jgi:hypothetical protein
LKKRINLAGIILVIFCIYAVFLCPLLISICSNDKKYTTDNAEIYVVKPGDSLWKIAERYPDEDIRRLVYEIKKANDTTADIRPGQVLKIPVSE